MEETSEDLVVVVDEAAMSVGDSEEEESESDGFSRTDSDSSRGESTQGQSNRKRPADESPEREWDETRRRKFPGTVTRSEGQCRVHIPSSIRAGALEVVARIITPAASTTDTTGVLLATDTTGVLPATNTTSVPLATDTMGAANPTSGLLTTEATDAASAPGASTTTSVTYCEESMSGVNATNVMDVLGDNVYATSIVYEEIVMLPEPMSTLTDDAPINLVGPTLPVQDEMERDVTPESGRVESLHINEPNVMIPSTSASQPNIVRGSISSVSTNTVTEPVMSVIVGIPLAAEGWARDAQVVEGICRIMEGMEPPWVTIEVLEAALVRFPTVDQETLQRTIMTVMMTQGRCVVHLTRAGLRRGPRTDREKNSFVELDLDFADRYSMSH